MDKKITLCTVHFNTPELMDALVKSIEMHVPCFHLYIFDNSDKEPYYTDNQNITIIDNTKGQIIDFNKWLEGYPNRFNSPGKVNKWGSAKHCYTIQKCIELIDKNFILLDSDILLKKDISEIIDTDYISVGSKELFQPKIGGSNYRIVPFLCYINVVKMKENNLYYFDDKRIYGLFHNRECETYDTGGSFYEDLIKINAFKHININDYIVHFRAGSWLQEARIKHNYKSPDINVWLEHYKYLWKTPNKKVVYTCITGGYEILPDIKQVDGWDYICFTDGDIKSDTWTIKPLPEEVKDLSTVRKQRYIKINPHKFLSDYDISLWIDGNMIPKGDIDDFIAEVNVTDEKPIGFKIHPGRDCIYDELEACIDWKRETREMVDMLYNFYTKEGFPKHQGLFETNIIVRKHNNPKCIELMERWSKELLEKSHRDQLSLTYCIWKLNADEWITKYPCRLASSYFSWRPHLNPKNTNPELNEKKKIYTPQTHNIIKIRRI